MQSSADWLALSPLALFVQRRLWRRADTTAALPVLLVLTGSGLANQRELALRFLRRLLRGCVGACRSPACRLWVYVGRRARLSVCVCGVVVCLPVGCVCLFRRRPSAVCLSVCLSWCLLACLSCCRLSSLSVWASGLRPLPPSFLCCWFLAGVAPWWVPGPWGSWPGLLGLGPCSLRNQFSSQSRFCQCTGDMLPYSRRPV
jgi:hypothetical protein